MAYVTISYIRLFGKNIVNIAKLGGIVGVGGFDDYKSRTGRYPEVMGAFPLGILAREILIEKNPIKALIISGNFCFASSAFGMVYLQIKNSVLVQPIIY